MFALRDWAAAVVLLSCAIVYGKEEEASKRPAWMSLDMHRVDAMSADAKLADRDVALEILHLLDDRITWYREFRRQGGVPPGGVWNPEGEYAFLARLLLWHRGGGGKALALSLGVEEGVASGISNTETVREFLVLARTAAGAWSEESRPVISAILTNAESNRDVVLLGLQGLAGHTEVVDLPALLRLARDGWTRILRKTGDRTHMYRFVREYPIREAVRTCLDDLGVGYKIVETPDPDYPQMEDLRHAELVVDAKGLVRLLGTHSESSDPTVWRPALVVLSKLDISEVEDVLKRLLESLPKEKKSFLEEIRGKGPEKGK